MRDYGNWCTVQALRAAVAAPPADVPADAVAEVYTAARRLAQDAYSSREPEAEKLAERLLYEIHVGNSYASPTGVLPAVIWQTLLAAHLRRHLEDVRIEPFDKKHLGARDGRGGGAPRRLEPSAGGTDVASGRRGHIRPLV